MGLARCGTVFPVSEAVGSALPAAVCHWGLCPHYPGVYIKLCVSIPDVISLSVGAVCSRINPGSERGNGRLVSTEAAGGDRNDGTAAAKTAAEKTAAAAAAVAAAATAVGEVILGANGEAILGGSET